MLEHSGSGLLSGWGCATASKAMQGDHSGLRLGAQSHPFSVSDGLHRRAPPANNLLLPVMYWLHLAIRSSTPGEEMVGRAAWACNMAGGRTAVFLGSRGRWTKHDEEEYRVQKTVQNTRKPQGFWGRVMLVGMNGGHKPLSAWAMPHLPLAEDARVLDVGCGGGANLAVLLRRCPRGYADGLDYSAESVAASRRKNAGELGNRCTVTQGDVGALPFSDDTYDAVTAFETVYFWPDLPRAFSEILRVMKPGGRFLLACESGDPSDTAWSSRIDGLTIYAGKDLKGRLEAAGFANVMLRETRNFWFCIVAEKPV